MSKKNLNQKGEINTKGNVFGGNRRWTASRLESVKSRGTRMVRKAKKG